MQVGSFTMVVVLLGCDSGVGQDLAGTPDSGSTVASYIQRYRVVAGSCPGSAHGRCPSRLQPHLPFSEVTEQAARNWQGKKDLGGSLSGGRKRGAFLPHVVQCAEHWVPDRNL